MHNSEKTSRWYGSLYRPDLLFMRRDLLRRVRNSAWRSEDFPNADWFKDNVGITSNDAGTLDPGGTQRADLVLDDGVNGLHDVGQYVNGGAVSGNATANAPVTVSVFVKKRDLEWMYISVFDDTSLGLAQWFDVATGKLGSSRTTASGITQHILEAGIDPYPHGWWRVWIVVRVEADTSVGYTIGLSSQDNETTYVGTGRGVWLWGAQSENNKDFVGPYVQTPASAAVEQGVDFNGTPRLVTTDNTDADSTGTKLSYTVPLDRRAKIKSATMFIRAGTPTVELRITDGSNVPAVASLTATGRVDTQFSLEAGDQIEWNVTVAGGASSFIDLTISIEELP